MLKCTTPTLCILLSFGFIFSANSLSSQSVLPSLKDRNPKVGVAIYFDFQDSFYFLNYSYSNAEIRSRKEPYSSNKMAFKEALGKATIEPILDLSFENYKYAHLFQPKFSSQFSFEIFSENPATPNTVDCLIRFRSFGYFSIDSEKNIVLESKENATVFSITEIQQHKHYSIVLLKAKEEDLHLYFSQEEEQFLLTKEYPITLAPNSHLGLRFGMGLKVKTQKEYLESVPSEGQSGRASRNSQTTSKDKKYFLKKIDDLKNNRDSTILKKVALEKNRDPDWIHYQIQVDEIDKQIKGLYDKIKDLEKSE